ncbi:glycosyltransferase family 4 protein [Kiritimatiellaeota bacterium B1221]|nr:glycosyltransferase family 4 protein [Kiritimatiellaeota bacterium B1221]
MIRILHHHLRRGGVTRVMYSQARILRNAGEEVEIWTGEPGADAIPEGVAVQVFPELGYREDYAEPDCEELTRKMLAVHQDGDLWHIHNHSLGKNPVVTETVRRLAEAGLPLILQIHDFAEDGRPANLKCLRDTLPDQTRGLYPMGAHVVYAVLQERDRGVLISAGVPADQVVVLPNPISMDMEVRPPQPTARRVLYLTRAIRRKNVGEFLYWAKVCAGDLEFATSLVPENPKEKLLFDRWVDFAHAVGISVGWGVGMSGASFQEVVSESDVCMTTSVGEGFGMSFLEPYAVQRPVVGRDLPEITAGFKADGVELDHLYAHLPVSVEDLDDTFWERALVAVNRWRQHMGLHQQCGEAQLQSAWVQAGKLDFGRLDEIAQMKIIQRLSRGKLSADDFLSVSSAAVERNAQTVSRVYNEEASLERLQVLYGKIQDVSPCEFADAARVRDAFTDLKTLSLLRI